MANNHTRRGPGGPGSGPRGGFRKPKDLRGTLGKLMGYLGRYKALLVIVVVCLIQTVFGHLASKADKRNR